MDKEKKIHGYVAGAPTRYGTPMFGITDEVIERYKKLALERLERRMALMCLGNRLGGSTSHDQFRHAGDHLFSVMWSTI